MYTCAHCGCTLEESECESCDYCDDDFCWLHDDPDEHNCSMAPYLEDDDDFYDDV